MKVVVGHQLWSRVGGSELVSAYVVKAFLEAGHSVIIASLTDFSKERYKEWFGIDIDNVKIYSLLPKMLPLLGLYQRILYYIPLIKAIKKEKPDIIFVDNEFYKPILRLKKERVEFRVLEYIHYPFHALLFARNKVPREIREFYDKYLSEARIYYREKYEKGLWKFYYGLYLEFYKRVARDNPFESADIVMTNSKYTAKLINILWGGEPLVLYPPVRINDFKPYGNKGFSERDDAVIMIGRISPEKRIEDVINAIAFTKTKPILRVIGGIDSRRIFYKKQLEKLAMEKNVRIEFHVNISRSEIIQLVSKSKVFIHATVGEHFGIAVVEGMAAGCPVIVHKSGGPYEDIIDYGNYGLYYESIDELAEKIDMLMNNENMWKYYHELSLKRALNFNEERFIENFLKIIKSI